MNFIGKTENCRKCLLLESVGGEELHHKMMEYIEDIPQHERVPEDEYKRRLQLCKNCERLTNGMCILCGCFVEVRAAKLRMSCAGGLW